jgi:hypothetical protein
MPLSLSRREEGSRQTCGESNTPQVNFGLPVNFGLLDGVCNPVRNVERHFWIAGRGLQPRP